MLHTLRLSKLFQSTVGIVETIKYLPNLLGKYVYLSTTTPETHDKSIKETLDKVGSKVFPPLSMDRRGTYGRQRRKKPPLK